MRIYIADSLIFDDDGCFDSLLRLFQRVRIEVHVLRVADVEGLLASSFFHRGLPPYQVDEWRELLRMSAFEADYVERAEEPGSRPRGVHAEVSMDIDGGRVSDECRWRVLPWDIGVWSERPLVILLENDNDASLLLGAARAYGMPALERACARNACVLDGRGGGGEVLRSVRAADPAGRYFAFVDSDRTVLGGEPGTTSRHIAAACRSARVPCRITEKREMENYLPRSHLKDHADRGAEHRRKFREWDRAGADFQDFGDLKAHFGEAWIAGVFSDMRSVGAMFSAADLDQRAGPEMRQVLAEIEDHL